MIVCIQCFTVTSDDEPSRFEEDAEFEACRSIRCRGANNRIRISDPLLASVIVQLTLKGYVPTAWSSGLEGEFMYIAFDINAFAAGTTVIIDSLMPPGKLSWGASDIVDTFESEKAMEVLSDRGEIIVYAPIPEFLDDDRRLVYCIDLCGAFRSWVDSLPTSRELALK